MYRQLIQEIEYVLSNAMDKRIDISRVENRVKIFDSFYDKVLRQEIRGDPFKSIDDIAGIRVVCLYRSQMQEIGKLIVQRLKVISLKVADRRMDMPFGYISDHYVVSLPDHFRGERYDAIKPLRCEIQVRTVSMHAWATISHHLYYKQAIEIPSHLRQDFTALSGMFYVADSLFEQFRDAHDASLRALRGSIRRSGFSLDEELNLDTLKAYLAWKFPSRKRDREPYVSELISDIRSVGIKSYRELDKIIENGRNRLITHEKKTKYFEDKKDGLGQYFTQVGVARMILRWARGKGKGKWLPLEGKRLREIGKRSRGRKRRSR